MGYVWNVGYVFDLKVKCVYVFMVYVDWFKEYVVVGIWNVDCMFGFYWLVV